MCAEQPDCQECALQAGDAGSGGWVAAAGGEWRGGGGGVGSHGAELGDALGQGFGGYVCGVCVGHNPMPADRNPKAANSEKKKF